MDTLRCATAIASNPRVNYTPGIFIRSESRPLSLPPHVGDRIEAEPGENIYKGPNPYPTSSHSPSLKRGDINAKVLYTVMRGERGASTDYAGAIMLAFYSNDPDAWVNLFYSEHTSVPIVTLLSRITGLTETNASRVYKLAESVFSKWKNDYSPSSHERIIRSLLEF